MRFDGDYTMTIGGHAVPGAATFEVLNPATEAVAGSAPDASQADLDQAVAAARTAFATWRATPIAERQDAVRRIAEVIRANAEDLKLLLTREQGKPHADAFAELHFSAFWCDEVAKQSLPVEIHEDNAERLVETRRTPLGVVGAIAPWNFPINLALWKVAPALVAGNTVVLKPSPFTPLTTLKIGELLRGVLPPGVLNIISGGDQLGPWLTAHEGIDKIAFTGSTATGRKVMQSAAASLKRVTLELGGNDATIVLPDVDVDAVAMQLFWGAFYNSGQICIAAKRMYIHEDIYDRLSQALVGIAGMIKVGDGALQGTNLGPIQNRLQFERVRDLIDDAKRNNLTFLCGGDVPDGKGYFVPVSIIDNPPDDSRIVTEEPFGPVLPLLRFSDTDDAIRRANASPYGLGGSVWSKDVAQARKVGEQLDCGALWINNFHYLSPHAPFGGHKQSGLGAENGIEGLLEYTNSQTVVVQRDKQEAVA